MKGNRLNAEAKRRAQADGDNAAIGFVGTEKPLAAKHSAAIDGLDEKGQPFELHAEAMKSKPDQQRKKHVAEAQQLVHLQYPFLQFFFLRFVSHSSWPAQLDHLSSHPAINPCRQYPD
jgi:hypothetical protein